MPRYSAVQIYGFARQAGFPPDQAATMTAVALAESNGNSAAHNARGENSKGLWQINAAAHPELATRFDLYDPLQNAKAAFEVSRAGSDISPWTTTHGEHRARYLRHRDDAEAAAVAHGDGSGRGVWTGTNGYGDRLAAGQPGDGSQAASQAARGPGDSGSAAVNTAAADRGVAGSQSPRRGEDHGIPVFHASSADRAGADHGIPVSGLGPGGSAIASEGAQASYAAATPAATLAQAPGGPGTSNQDVPGTRRFLDAALAQSGDPYVFGAQTSMQDSNPRAFDCSELTRWAAAQAGVTIPDGTWLQYLSLKEAGHIVPVEDAVRTPGALLFSFSEEPTLGGGRPRAAHVAISLGDGSTIEAKGTRYGVGSWEATTKRFQYAAVIPGLSGDQGAGGGTGQGGPVTREPTVPAEAYTAAPAPGPAFGTAAGLAGQGPGGAPSAHQAALASGDEDRDGLTDVLERRLGLDPYRMDTDRDSLADSEELLKTHTDPRLADSDWDGRSDAAEIKEGDDPTDPDSDDDGHLDGSRPDTWVDTDADGLDDELERVLRLSPTRTDSDGDGFTDRLEHDLGWDTAGPDASDAADATSLGGSGMWGQAVAPDAGGPTA